MLLSLDVETGGPGLEYSLLTASFLLAEENFDVQESLSLVLKPNDGIYRVCGRALELTKINLVEHDDSALTYKKGGTLLFDTLRKWSSFGTQKLTPVGKSVHGDFKQIWENLISKNSWDQFVSFQFLDVTCLFQFLKLLGKVPETINGSLEDIADFYNIDRSGLHCSDRDARITLDCLRSIYRTAHVPPNRSIHYEEQSRDD